MTIQRSTFLCTKILESGTHKTFWILLALFGFINTATAQYAETIIYDSDAPPTLSGGETVTPSILDVTINNSGDVAFGGDVSGGSLSMPFNAIFRLNGQQGSQIEILYQAVAPGADCLIANTSNCLLSPSVVATSFFGATIINDSGQVAFLNSGFTEAPAFENRREIISGDGITTTILIQNADDGAGSVYSELSLSDFNNQGFAVGGMTGSCPAMGGLNVGIVGDGSQIVGTTFGGVTDVAPPGNSYFNECIDANVTYFITFVAALESNGNGVYFVGTRQQGGGFPETGIFNYDQGISSFVYSLAGGVSTISDIFDLAANDQGEIVFVDQRPNPAPNSVPFRDLVLVDTSSTPATTTIIMSTDPDVNPGPRTWLDMSPGESFAINASGAVAFAANESQVGPQVWVYDPNSGNIDLVSSTPNNSVALNPNGCLLYTSPSPRD